MKVYAVLKNGAGTKFFGNPEDFVVWLSKQKIKEFVWFEVRYDDTENSNKKTR